MAILNSNVKSVLSGKKLKNQQYTKLLKKMNINLELNLS